METAHIPPHALTTNAIRGNQLQPARDSLLPFPICGYMLQNMLATTCHCTRLRRTAHALTRLYDAALAETGLTVTQFSLLRTISRLEQPYITTLAEATGLERSTLGRNLRPLERAGLIEFTAGDDGRTRLVRLSRAGRRTLGRAIPLWQHAQDQVHKSLGERKIAALTALLEDVIADPDSPLGRTGATPA